MNTQTSNKFHYFGRVKHLIYILFFFTFFNVNSQVNVDSLMHVWNDSRQPDTIRLKAMHNAIWGAYLFSQPDSAYYFAQLQYDFAEKSSSESQMANALNTQGISFAIRGDFSKSIQHFERGLIINEKVGDKIGIASSLNNIGNIHWKRGDYTNAINYYTRSLTLKEELGNKDGMVSTLNNIGNIYKDQGSLDKSIDYYTRSLKIGKETGNKEGIAIALNNIGTIYQDQASLAPKNNKDDIERLYQKALDNHNKSLVIYKEIESKHGVANTLNNIGTLYKSQLNEVSLDSTKTREQIIQKALDFCFESLKLREELGEKEGIASCLSDLGEIYKEKGDYIKAESYSSRAIIIAQKIGAARETKSAANALYHVYKWKGKSALALEYYELYIVMKDSISNEKNQKEVIRLEFEYNYDKQYLADSLHFIQQKELEQIAHDSDLVKEENQRYILYVGLLFTLLLGATAFWAYYRKKKDNVFITNQKLEVELQKQIVEEKNKEITDSIQYAKRIQNAILPSRSIVNEYLPNSFILYKPKDIVAGDFYWIEYRKDKVFVATADCTGHGVPGALVSVICNNGLNRSLREHGLLDPGKILDKTREIVIQEFEKSDEDVKDGMDIALVSFAFPANDSSTNLETKDSFTRLQYSGANIPIWIVRKGANEIEEIKADKQPIGKFVNPQPYKTHSIELEKGDSFYLFSDGYVDQFGGENLNVGKLGGKKFKAKALRELLLSIQDKSMEDQKKHLNDTFELWKGDLEQIDDVCVIGVRV